MYNIKRFLHTLIYSKGLKSFTNHIEVFFFPPKKIAALSVQNVTFFGSDVTYFKQKFFVAKKFYKKIFKHKIFEMKKNFSKKSLKVEILK